MRYLLLFLMLYSWSCDAQHLKFHSPLKGVNGKDFYLMYADHDASDGVQDAFCGSNSYNGHTGTDFILRSFQQMDSGVVIYAMADGQVIGRSDGASDRNTDGNTAGKSPGFGNYVEVLHGDYVVHYAHLMRKSLLVQRGEYVRAGQPIAKVGSSGVSTQPHLHIEVNDGYGSMDPFGTCAEKNSLWAGDLAYDTSVYAIESGFIPYVPRLDKLKERASVRDTFNMRSDTTVCFWAMMHGLQKGDSVRVDWVGPKNKLYSTYHYTWLNSLWVDYLWTYLKMPRIKGKWSALLYINGKLYGARQFYIQKG